MTRIYLFGRNAVSCLDFCKNMNKQINFKLHRVPLIVSQTDYEELLWNN